MSFEKETRPGRNEPCHCGSKKKYKKCHLRQDQEADEARRQAGPARQQHAYDVEAAMERMARLEAQQKAYDAQIATLSDEEILRQLEALGALNPMAQLDAMIVSRKFSGGIDILYMFDGIENGDTIKNMDDEMFGADLVDEYWRRHHPDVPHISPIRERLDALHLQYEESTTDHARRLEAAIESWRTIIPLFLEPHGTIALASRWEGTWDVALDWHAEQLVDAAHHMGGLRDEHQDVVDALRHFFAQEPRLSESHPLIVTRASSNACHAHHHEHTALQPSTGLGEGLHRRNLRARVHS